MAIKGMPLSRAMRANLMSLQQTANMLGPTQTRPAAARKVHSAFDNPTNYSTGEGPLTRPSDLDAPRHQMNDAIQTVKEANAGIKAITGLIELARSLAQSAVDSTDPTVRADYAAQFGAVRAHIHALAGDSGSKGTNTINGDTLGVKFNKDDSPLLSTRAPHPPALIGQGGRPQPGDRFGD